MLHNHDQWQRTTALHAPAAQHIMQQLLATGAMPAAAAAATQTTRAHLSTCISSSPTCTPAQCDVTPIGEARRRPTGVATSGTAAGIPGAAAICCHCCCLPRHQQSGPASLLFIKVSTQTNFCTGHDDHALRVALLHNRGKILSLYKLPPWPLIQQHKHLLNRATGSPEVLITSTLVVVQL